MLPFVVQFSIFALGFVTQVGAKNGAKIISISNIDAFRHTWCNRSADAAIIAEEGSPMGPLLRAVNAVADAIKPEFPNVAISTLACELLCSSCLGAVVSLLCSGISLTLCCIYCYRSAHDEAAAPDKAPSECDRTAVCRLQRLLPHRCPWEHGLCGRSSDLEQDIAAHLHLYALSPFRPFMNP